MDDKALLAVCRTTYRRVMHASGGDFQMVQMAAVQDVRRAGFEVDADAIDLVSGVATCIVALADGREVFRSHGGNFTIGRDYE